MLSDALHSPAVHAASNRPAARNPRKPRTAAQADKRGRPAWLGACIGIHALGLAACAPLGALRFVDLVIAAAVLVVAYALAMRDSRHLVTYLFGVWVFSRLVRRLVDWQLGEYTSLTALSLLPLLATLTVLVPFMPRIKQLPRKLRLALILILGPMAYAAAIGFLRFGPSAAVDAAGWIVPVLFVPYLATRPTTRAEAAGMLRGIVVLASVAAAYAWYQFLVLPPWDEMWLIESGMISSMGQAEALNIRVWGPMNSTGPAAGVWSAALLLTLMDRRWPLATRLSVAGLLGTALLLTRVRICWLTTLIGLLVWAALQGGKRGGQAALLGAVVVAGLVFAAPYLPGGDKITDRLATFENLAEDQSFQTRKSILYSLTDTIAASPLGVGFGFTSAGKVEDGQAGIAAFDNGVGQLIYTVGFPGAGLWFIGMLLLARCIWERRQRIAEGTEPGIVLGVVLAVTLAAAYSYSGVSSLAYWCAAGLGLAVLERVRGTATVGRAGLRRSSAAERIA